MNGPSLERLAHLAQYLAADPNNPHLLSEAAACAYQVGDARCEQYCDTLLLHEPAHAQARYLKARIQMDQGHWAQALEQFKALLIDHPRDLVLSFYASACLARLGELPAALELLAPSLKDPAQFPEATVLLARLHYQCGDAIAARQLLEALAACTTLPAEGAALLALILADMHEFEAATHWAKGVLAQHPAQHDATLALATCSLEQQDFNTAQALFQSALQHRRDSTRAQFGLGIIALGRQQLPEAEACIRACLRQWPDNAGCWNTLAWICIFSGRLEEAEAHFRHVIKQVPAFGESRGGLALLLIQRGQLDEAEREITVGRRLSPSAVSVKYAEALLAHARGDEIKAQQHLQHFLDIPLGSEGRPLKDVIPQAMSKLAPPGQH